MKINYGPTLQRISSEGQGNMSYAANNAPGGAGVTGANNGLSVAGTIVQLGGPDGAAAAAVLLNNREIPLGGFSFKISGIGNTATAIPIFKVDAAKALTTPIWSVQTSAGTELMALRAASPTDVYLGFLAGGLVTAAGNNNIGIGNQALENNTGGAQNVAVGAICMGAGLNTGGNNVAVGFSCLNANTSGSSNNAIGNSAMTTNTTGSNNCAIGGGANSRRTIGTDNTCMGQGSMGESTVATNNSIQNSAFGSGCFQQNNIGNNNVGMGFQCGFNTTMSNNNILFGATCLSGTVQTIGSNNIIIGGAINSLLAVNNNNIWIGANLSINLANIVNTTIIGQGITGTISNVFILGRSDQNIIVGNTAPGADNGNRLQINGKLNTGGAAPLTAGAGAWDFGNLITAASALNATRYLEVSVAGVLYKVCIN